MGTSLSGLTPATTFDGLLKTSDNEPLDGTLKTIGTGDGTDSILQLSNSAFQVNGAATINGGQATIVGAGNDATTTAFLVQNSDATQLFKVDDAGSATGISFKTTALTMNANQILGSSGIKLINTTQANGGTSISTADGAPANKMLYVKGFGATAATTSLLVQNSSGARLMEVQDGGNIFFGPGASNYLQNGYNLFGNYNAIGSWNIGTASAMGARVGIKGTGATSATTALVVQNSAGTEMFKVRDDGTLVAPNLPTSATGLPTGAIWNDGGTLKIV